MLPISHLDLRALVTAGQAAVRATEDHGSPQTAAAVTRALCELPLTVMDTAAEHLLRDALRAPAGAEGAQEWTLLADGRARGRRAAPRAGRLRSSRPRPRRSVGSGTACFR